MKAMKQGKMAAAAFALAVGFALAASAEVTWKTLDNGFKYVIGGDDDPQPGVWDARYDKVIAYASANGIPVVAFYGKTGCARCNRLETELGVASKDEWLGRGLSGTDNYCKDDYYPEWIEDGYPNYPEWIKKRGYLLLFGLNPGGDGGKVRALIKRGSSLPYVSVWWDKDGDGETDIGKANTLTWAGSSGNQHVSRLMKNSDAIINRNGGYSPIPEYAGGTFDFEETEGDRMECEEGTETVSFTLTRGEKESEYESEVILVAKGPDGDGVDRQTISWEEGESNKTVTVNIAGANFTEDGQQLSIILTDTNGVDRVTNHVTYVKKENSSSNPLWIGERASPKRGAGLLSATPTPNLEFGEWTMDLDAAKALAASTEGDAYTLVMVSGVLWCPNCENFENNFLTLTNAEGEVKFTKWARENNVSLAVVDVGRLTGGTDELPTLLSRTPGRSSLAVAGGTGKASGRGYMTRKGISDEEGAAQIEENKRLARTFTAEGGFIRPEDTEDKSCNGYRPRVPCFYILRKDGTVAARLSRFTFPTTPTAADQQWFDNYLKRFDEMLAIAGKDDSAHADKEEVENDYAATTAASIVANGGSVDAELSSADLRDAYILDKFAGNATIALSLTGESDAQVELTLWQVKDGEATVITGASRTGKLSSGVTLEYAFADAGRYAVQVAAQNRGPAVAYLDDEFSPTNGAAMNFTSYTLTSHATYTPGPAPGTASAPEGSKQVRIQLEAGVLYKLVGLDAESDANTKALEAVESVDGFYTAKQSGIVLLDAASEGGEVTYQKWEPGSVGFAPDAVTQKTEVTVSESTNLLVGVRRVTGVSGEVTVKISLNKDETDFYYDYYEEGVENNKTLPRFKVDGEADFVEKTITWADGQPLEECIDSLLVQAADSEVELISQYFGPGKVVFDFTIVAQTEAGEATNVVDNGKFTINFKEDQKPVSGTVAILDAVNDDGEGWVAKQTIYARESGEATLTLGRLVADQGPVYAELASSVKTVKFGGDYDPLLGVFWNNHDSADKTVTVTNLPAAGKNVKLTLKASELNKDLGVLKASNTVTIVSVAADAPSFSAPSYDDTVYRFAAVSNVYPVVCEEGDAMSYTKVSGALPAGLKASVDPVTRGLLIRGVPTGNDKAGKTYTAVFQAVAARGRSKVKGLAATVSLTVKDPAAEGTGADGEALNGTFATTKKFGDIMVFKTAEDGQSAELAGMLTGLTIPAKGNASAKFVCAAGKISLSAKNWAEVVDNETGDDYGTLRLTLTGKGGYSLDVDASRDGAVEALLSNGDELYEKIEPEEAEWSSKNSAKDCVGYYTVSLPVAEVDNYGTLAIVENREGFASRAAAYLTFTMTSASDANKGLMKWAGMLPNGEKVSGSSVLATMGDEDNVYLPYWSFKAKDQFAGVAKILRGAKDRSADFDGDDSCYETVFMPEFDFGEGERPVRTVWRHSESNKETKDGDYEVAYDVYGGIYDSSLGLDCFCIDSLGTDVMEFAVGKPAAPSDVYGEFDAVTPLRVKVSEKSMSLPDGGGEQKATLKFNSKTGVVSGKFNLSYKDASGKTKAVSASYNGVVQLGFGDTCGCETNPQPFVNGFWVFGDKLSYINAANRGKTINVKRGGSVIIDPAH